MMEFDRPRRESGNPGCGPRPSSSAPPRGSPSGRGDDCSAASQPLQPGRRSLDRRLERAFPRDVPLALRRAAAASSARLWTRLARSQAAVHAPRPLPGRGPVEGRGAVSLDHAREVDRRRQPRRDFQRASRQRYSRNRPVSPPRPRRPQLIRADPRDRDHPRPSVYRDRPDSGRGGEGPRRTFAPDRSDHCPPADAAGGAAGDATALAGEGSRPVQIASVSKLRPLAA